ncbi:efflux RND transporter periplasmic adaptor subunit [Polaromonas sp. YR568]|uniref:efflux RND transporter periplasmic adaptor subunit n=1 Tax=Polaromonas sp. YR568 TaxID=1855301 RepID=UPI0031381000
MTSRTKWIVGALVLLLIAGGVVRALSGRQAQKQALADASATKDIGSVELADTDLVKASTRELIQGLPISGALKAVNSAVIKARVAGELKDLKVREGDTVKAGQVIARIDDAEFQSRMRQAMQQAESARAQVDVAQRQYDNNKALVDQGFISKTALDTSLANLNAARSSYQAAVAGTDVTRKSVQDTVLRSPIDGQVSQRLAQPGERVGVDARIVEIVDLRQLELEAALSAADAMDVRVGQKADLQIEGSRQTIEATVVRINPAAQAGSRSVLAYLGINNANGPAGAPSGLRQGLFAQGTLGTARSQLRVVPVTAVRTDKPSPYVQTVENGQVVHRTVQTGPRGTVAGSATSAAEPVVSVTGLAEEALVIRGAIGALREGTKVRVTALTAAPAKLPAQLPANGKPAP